VKITQFWRRSRVFLTRKYHSDDCLIQCKRLTTLITYPIYRSISDYLCFWFIARKCRNL